MSQEYSHLVFLSVARPGLDNDYAFQELLAEHFQVPITALHDALGPADICPLMQDEYCSDLGALLEALNRFEDFDRKSLADLGQQKQTRVILLLEDDRCHPEVLVAFGLLVVGVARTYPEVMAIHLEEESDPMNWQIISHFQPGLLLDQAAKARSSWQGEPSEAHRCS